ncbi:ATP-binding cassette domain-containing protein, partial [Pandoraea nosoerga]|nr:ATP-binding cassette domain-containing protein [Pandoraea nosoerga]
MTALLAIENLSKRFGGLQAVADVSLKVSSGEICSVIGPNGAGKTTLFNMISGVLRPSGGRISFDGIDLATISPWKFAAVGIGRTFQNVALFPNLSVIDNVRVGAHARTSSDIVSDSLRLAWVRRGENDMNKKVHDILGYLDLESVAHTVVSGLPFGTQK